MMNQESNDPWANPEFEHSVRDTAYFLWENDGRPEGREQEYWFQALEKCLFQRQSDKLLAQNSQPDRQFDDNIDDLGRKVSGVGGVQEQPTSPVPK